MAQQGLRRILSASKVPEWEMVTGMEKSLSAMETCLRVLRAFKNRQEPSPDDLQKLRAIAGSDLSGIEPDELACGVIQKILDERAAARGWTNHRPRKR